MTSNVLCLETEIFNARISKEAAEVHLQNITKCGGDNVFTCFLLDWQNVNETAWNCIWVFEIVRECIFMGTIKNRTQSF